MQEKKNNAVEKMEKAIENSSNKEGSKNNQKTAKKNVKNSKRSAQKKASEKEKRRAKIVAERKEQALKKKEEREKVKIERERLAAQRRVELARIKAHRKAEKEKARATALREKNRRKAELKERKAQIKAEREARRQLLKSETKKERAKRLAAEKAAIQEARREKRLHRAELKRQKLEERREKAAQRARDRQKNRERNRGTGGWLAAVIALGLSTLVLASVLTFVFMMPTAEGGMLESTYRKSFYDTIEQVDNIDLNLSKALATSDSGALQQYLVNTAINSELAENDLQQLPLQDENKFYTTKLINQIGDYSKYLNNKIINGEQLTEKDYEGLVQLYKANLAFKDMLASMNEKLANDYSFTSIMDGGDGNLVISGFNDLQNLSVEYPELIYDGPFSDGLNNREIKGLGGEEISEAEATERFKSIFASYELKDVEAVGTTSNNLECYNVQTTVDGDLLFAQISKKGGELVMFSYAGSCNGVNVERETAVDTAQKFLENVGIKNMKAVWVNLSNNLYTVNLAYEQSGIIVYSDLAKVRVCAQTGKVIGMEASSYYTNHTDRAIGKAGMSDEAAAEKVSDKIEIETSRLVLVPIGNSSEKLCYEFMGNYDGSTYYVYIDAVSGRQVEMFKVIESTEGTLLM